jgi:hypothetical protein
MALKADVIFVNKNKADHPDFSIEKGMSESPIPRSTSHLQPG